MDTEKLESLLIDYIDGKLSPEEASRVELELSRDNQAYELYTQLREVIHLMDKTRPMEARRDAHAAFDRVIQEQLSSTNKKRTFVLHPAVYRMAAAVALVMVGVGIGYWINKNNQQSAELAALRKEMKETKSMMMAMLDNQQSASKRIQGVNVAMTIEQADDDVVRALVNTMNHDKNTNVRLTALEALSKFYREPLVRKELIESLSTQDDPMVQISLIQLLVRMKETGVVKELERIIDNDKTSKPVRDEAYTGLLKLS